MLDCYCFMGLGSSHMCAKHFLKFTNGVFPLQVKGGIGWIGAGTTLQQNIFKVNQGWAGCEAKCEAQVEALIGVTWPSNAPGTRPCQNSDLKVRPEIRSEINSQ